MKKIVLFIVLFFVISGIVFLSGSSIKKITNLNSLSLPSKLDLTLSPPSIESVFASNHSWIATFSSQRKTTLIATGDVIPARVVNVNSLKNNSFTWAFEKTAEVTKNADITFINLETPLLANCPTTNVGMTFCGSNKHIEGLKLAGVDIASLANNHAGNHGQEGVYETKTLLEENGIKITGISGPTFYKAKNITFAFLGYDDIDQKLPYLSWVDEGKIQQEVGEARKKADVVVVTFHWGTEYKNQPDPRQVELGHLAIDSGADLIIGNHPHWIQPIEVYKNKLITYAHGNFIFDQMWSQKTREGVVGKYTFYDNKLIDVEFLPILIEDYGQPHFLEGLEKQRILDDMKKESFKLLDSINKKGD